MVSCCPSVYVYSSCTCSSQTRTTESCLLPPDETSGPCQQRFGATLLCTMSTASSVAVLEATLFSADSLLFAPLEDVVWLPISSRSDPDNRDAIRAAKWVHQPSSPESTLPQDIIALLRVSVIGVIHDPVVRCHQYYDTSPTVHLRGTTTCTFDAWIGPVSEDAAACVQWERTMKALCRIADWARTGMAHNDDEREGRADYSCLLSDPTDLKKCRVRVRGKHACSGDVRKSDLNQVSLPCSLTIIHSQHYGYPIMTPNGALSLMKQPSDVPLGKAIAVTFSLKYDSSTTVGPRVAAMLSQLTLL